MFRQKEQDILKSGASPKAVTPKDSAVRGHASFNNINLSPRSPPSNLAAPSFVSPGVRGSWTKSKKASHLDGAPGVPFSPSPVKIDKPKVNAKSWRDKPAISFQATPRGSATNTPKSTTPTFAHYGGSYLKKSTTSSSMADATPADIKIQVKIPNIEAKIKARRAKATPPPPIPDQKVPEHILKFRQREEARKKAMDQKEFQAASKIQAFFLGWRARVNYIHLRKANQERLRRIQIQEQQRKARLRAALIIQKTWRMHLPRKRYIFLKACRRRRQRNQREITRIQNVLDKIPKKSKAEIKEMKKAYAEKRKELKRNIRNSLKEEEDKLEEIKKSGRNMIQYLQDEKKRLKEQQSITKKEYQLLEQQFQVLTEKSEEIANNFQSLQDFVDKIQHKIQHHEISSQKCRHRYLPKYRAEKAERNAYCLVEHRVKVLYKERLYRIVKEIVEQSSDETLIREAQDALETCEDELQRMQEIPVPEGLMNRL